MRTPTSMLALGLLVLACNSGSSPTSPSPAASSPSAPSASGDQWLVTQRFVSVEGPDNCWVRQQRGWLTGAVFPDLPMTVTRSGASIELESDFFEVNYAGTLSGSEFSASGGPIGGGGGRPCEDGTLFQQNPGVSALSGRFSEDDRNMTATEVNSYRLTTGEPVTYTWDWQARR